MSRRCWSKIAGARQEAKYAEPDHFATGLGWKYYRPDRLLDPRGRDVTEAGFVPLDTPVTRVMPQVGRWSPISRLSVSASVSSP